jgi:hypothetical protein
MADFRALVVAWRGQQQPGHQLGGRGGVQGDGAAADAAVAADGEQDLVAAAAVVDRRAEFPQRREQRADRPRRRPVVAAEFHVRRGERGDRRDEPQHGAGVPDVDHRAARGVPGGGFTARRRRHQPGRRRPGAGLTAAWLAVTCAPSARRAAAISSVSRASSGLLIVVGPSASAASTRARLVIDFDPGSRTSARTGPLAAGAAQSRARAASVGPLACPAPLSMLRAYWLGERLTRAGRAADPRRTGAGIGARPGRPGGLVALLMFGKPGCWL